MARPHDLTEYPPSTHPDDLVSLFGLLHVGQSFLRLTVDTIHQLLVGISDPVALQHSLAQPAQDASVDGAKPEPVDQQGSGLSNDFILEDEKRWWDGMLGEVRFKLEKRVEPCGGAYEYWYAVLK